MTMTREEAIKELYAWLDGCCGDEEIEPAREAFRMAIEALRSKIDWDLPISPLLKDMTNPDKKRFGTDYKTNHRYMWLCPKCGLSVHSDFAKCVRCGHDLITIDKQAAIYALADYIHNVDKVYNTGHLSTADCEDAARSVLEGWLSVQPDLTLESAINYLHSVGWMESHDKQMYEDGQRHAQPEIIRCRDCIAYQEGIDIDGKPFTRCNGSVRTYGHTLPDWYCADAERRTDEQTN